MTKFSPSEFQNMDNMLKETYHSILHEGELIKSKRGCIKEIRNYTATLTDIQNRCSASLDRKLIMSKFAEYIWYRSGKDDRNAIKRYINLYKNEEREGEAILGAYGPKLFRQINGKNSQWDRARDQLRIRPNSKQVYLSISESSDYKVRTNKHHSPPCTIGLHLYCRNDKLHMTAYMRSNDAYYGLPHDAFAFSMLQEQMALELDIAPGHYTHSVTSMHLYDKHFEGAQSYIDEGFMSNKPFKGRMPRMQQPTESELQNVISIFENSIYDESLLQSISNDYWRGISEIISLIHLSKLDRIKLIETINIKELKTIAKNSLDEKVN